MPKLKYINPEFIELIPSELKEGVLYISCKNLAMIHLCGCGCGTPVITPLSRTGWELRFNGENISVYPSIGNWNLKCQSHYWIRDNKIIWIRNRINIYGKNHFGSVIYRAENWWSSLFK